MSKNEPIVYSLISRGKTVLAEHTFTTGNFTTITRVLLNKIKDADSRQSIQYDDYVFHIIVEDRVTYLCMSEDKKSVQVSFQFLDDIKTKFQERYKEAVHTAIAFQMDAEFKRVLERQMLYYNNPNNSSTTRLASKLDTGKQTGEFSGRWSRGKLNGKNVSDLDEEAERLGPPTFLLLSFSFSFSYTFTCSLC